MIILKARIAAFMLLAVPTTAHPTPPRLSVPPAQPAPAGVQEALQTQADLLGKQIDGRLGVAIRLLETGESAAVNIESYPMASTYKVAIAGALLSRVDKGEVALDKLIPVTQRDVDATGAVADHVIHPGVNLSVANLMELMLTQSNNTATDKILALAGGPKAVTAWVRSVGVDGLRVDRSVNEILNDFFGVPKGQPFTKTYINAAMSEEVFDKVSLFPNPAFEKDSRDAALPTAMVDLLGRLLAGPLLKPASRDFLNGVMERCETGAGRIKGMLPVGTIVAHKTGTLGGSANDVGMITLPNGRGHLLMAVYIKGSNLPAEQRERAIAEIARTAFDYFILR